MLAPIINFGIRKLSKKQFAYLIIAFTIGYRILNYTGNSTIGMIYMYLIGAYIRMHKTIKKEGSYYLLKAIILLIAIEIIKIICIQISGNIRKDFIMCVYEIYNN